MTANEPSDYTDYTPDYTGPEEEAKMVILCSAEEFEFELPLKAAQEAEIVNDAYDEDSESLAPMPMARVSTECLRKVVDFLKHHYEEPMTEIPTPLGGNTFEEVMPQKWYQEFLADENMPQEMLFEVLTAANYMGIKPLLDLACLKVTFQLNGKSAEEIRQILNLPELTAEEEARAREEHRWIFEDNYP